MNQTTVISLVGRTKSGKTTLAKLLARYLRTSHIEVSDLVRSIQSGLSPDEIKASRERTKEDPQWLGREIAKSIERRLESRDKSVILVSGIREVEVVEYLKDKYLYYGFEIRSDVPVRFERAINDGKYKNADEFIQGEIRELDLGLQEVEDDAPYAVPTSPLTDPERIIKAMAKRLRSNGANLR